MFALIFSTLTLSLCAVGLKANTVMIQSPGALVVREGETVEIRCVLNSTDVNDIVNKFDVHWYNSRNGKQILGLDVNGYTYRSLGFSDRFQLSRDDASNSYLLTIREVVIDDSADYICGLWGVKFGNGTQLNVTIANPPILIQFPRLERVTEGHTARLRCSMENAEVGNTDVHWYRELPRQDMEWILTHEAGGSVRRRPGFTERFQPFRDVSNSSFILTVTNVMLNDYALYYCTVWGDIRGNGTQLNVTNANPPILIQFPRLERVTEGHTARLHCSMENAEVGNTDVHWYRELPGQDMEWVLTHEAGGSIRRRPGFTEQFQSFKDTSNSSFILTVTNVMLNDSAVYYCTVWGDIRGNGTQVNVTISQKKENQVVMMYLAWIILPLVLGVLAVTGAICLIRHRASGSHQSCMCN
ncbi:uncharacterized protein LOC116976517 [Amblyraja radiata]|uniref:uncharacterized protein LOC116976517 n=1 Tax=Amblyraja radiata TaxID=386614 RepID=UPI001402250E|nr:uncharacterized protein LOC116976517 [Amblyraja radiata]